MNEIDKLGKYEIHSILGQGAMGIVYKGFDPHIERTVAIKTIRKDALEDKEMTPLLARFKREAQAAGRLTHHNIVTVYEYGEEENTAYIAMEFVHGRELKGFLDNNERFPLNTIFNIISQLLDALAYSHSKGVVHRDIKPGNILILKNGQIKVTDFGIARIESSTLTQFGDVIGTPSYMSPEQFAGHQIDKRSDLFSTGVILYHLLTGEKPFPGNSMTTIMHRVMNTDPPLVSDLNFQVPSYLDAVTIKALAKKPEQRFQSAEEFKKSLTSAATAGAGEASANNTEETVMIGGQSAGQATEATVMVGSNDPTENIPAAPPDSTDHSEAKGTDINLEQKFERIVDLLESKGVPTDQGRKSYKIARAVVLTFLVLTILTGFGYAVWLIYSEDLTYPELEQIVKEKVEDISKLVSGANPKILEISQSLKSKPAKEFQDKPDPRERDDVSDTKSEQTDSKIGNNLKRN